jgi:hypothetical protein
MIIPPTYFCPACSEPYDTEELAADCMNGHARGRERRTDNPVLRAFVDAIIDAARGKQLPPEGCTFPPLKDNGPAGGQGR